MTPKEHLKLLGNGFIIVDGKKEPIKNTNHYYFVEKALAELEELKRYPTVDEVCEALQGLASYIMYTDDNSDESASAIEWHNTIRQALTELEELKRDVKRYFCIIKKAMTFDGVVIDEKEQVEFEELQDKLMKVGKEE